MWLRYTHQGRERTIGLETSPIIIGRHAPNLGEAVLIQIEDDPLVSRRHAEIMVDDDGTWWLQDLGSTNGTRVDGASIPAHRKVALSPGIDVQVGDTVLHVTE
jgi:pSer/pThr/pTyr-binding forkhead associated (FHA) protein